MVGNVNPRDTYYVNCECESYAVVFIFSDQIMAISHDSFRGQITRRYPKNFGTKESLQVSIYRLNQAFMDNWPFINIEYAIDT